MFRASRASLYHSTRRLRAAAKDFSSHSSTTVPGQDDSFKGKVKAELKKSLKINLVLIPVILFVCLYFFPTPSAEEERRMVIEYEKNAGWKT